MRNTIAQTLTGAAIGALMALSAVSTKTFSEGRALYLANKPAFTAPLPHVMLGAKHGAAFK